MDDYDYWSRPLCECLDCGKTWRRGEQDDNEKYCLRCCAESANNRIFGNTENYDGDQGPDDHQDWLDH